MPLDVDIDYSPYWRLVGSPGGGMTGRLADDACPV